MAVLLFREHCPYPLSTGITVEDVWAAWVWIRQHWCLSVSPSVDQRLSGTPISTRTVFLGYTGDREVRQYRQSSSQICGISAESKGAPHLILVFRLRPSPLNINLSRISLRPSTTYRMSKEWHFLLKQNTLLGVQFRLAFLNRWNTSSRFGNSSSNVLPDTMTSSK